MTPREIAGFVLFMLGGDLLLGYGAVALFGLSVATVVIVIGAADLMIAGLMIAGPPSGSGR